MKRVYLVEVTRKFGTAKAYNVVAISAEEAIRKSRRKAMSETGYRGHWRCRSLSETGTVIL